MKSLYKTLPWLLAGLFIFGLVRYVAFLDKEDSERPTAEDWATVEEEWRELSDNDRGFVCFLFEQMGEEEFIRMATDEGGSVAIAKVKVEVMERDCNDY